MKRAYSDIPEGQVHYRSEGNGQPLLLLHQAVVSSMEYSRIIPILSKTHWVIAMDMMGCGESDKPPQAYQIEDYSRTVASFLDSLGIKKASVLGHHTGALIGIELAATHQERVEKLILSGPVAQRFILDVNASPPKLPYATWKEAFGFWDITSDFSFLQKVWGKVQAFAPNVSPDIKYEMCVEYLQAGPRGEESHWAAAAYDPQPRLPFIKCPTLVLCGTEDPFFPEIDNVKNLIPRARSFIIEGPRSGSSITREMPQEFAEAVLKFLREDGM